jgi:hypothetical protein
MSYDIFKQNMLSYMRNQKNIGSKEDFAKKLVQEYDFLIKRGFDTLNGIKLQQGNTELMESILIGVLNTAFQQSSGEHAIITNIGKAFQGYWTGGSMYLFPPPVPSITPLGVFVHISQVSNFITNSGTWGIVDTTTLTPPTEQPVDTTDIYDKLDWSKIPLDKNDLEVQEIIKPNLNKIDQQIRSSGSTNDLGRAGATQLNNVKAQIIDTALYEQGIIPVNDTDSNLKSGYKNLDELLKIAGSVAPKLGKNPRVNYGNLKSGYIKGVHGLCPQGTQAVVVALTGITGLGRISGNADWFSFKDPSTGGGRSSFAQNIGGKSYYNDKVKVGSDFITNPSQWQVGDIIVMGYTNNKPYGHIQVWTGFKWVSDFTQRGVQQNNVDFTTIALWRLNENGKLAVQSQKNKSV